MDTDKSGLIDAKELKTAINDSNLKIKDKELTDLINNIDANDNQEIDYTEFITSCL